MSLAVAGDRDACGRDASGWDGDGRRGLLPLEAVAPPPRDPLQFPGHAVELAYASHRTGVRDSVTTGVGTLAGTEVVAVVGEFGFLGGSMGRAHGQAVADAMREACRRRAPLVVVTRSGGARMQEGMLALSQMSRVAEGIRGLREHGIPVIARFAHPTTGGVHASYGSSADVIVADAGATVGFAGPRVVEVVTGRRPGADSHTAEAALRDGAVDEVAPSDDAASVLGAWVALLHPALRHGPLPSPRRIERSATVIDGARAVELSRDPSRPTGRALVADVFDEHRELRGDRCGADDPTLAVFVARLGQRRVLVVASDRHAAGYRSPELTGAPSDAAFRKARRGVELADRWRLPLVTLIDLPGADPSARAESGGLSSAIAELFQAVLSIASPTVGVVVGQGGSGPALALACTDRVLMLEDSSFNVIAPEAAAAILRRDTTDVADLARQLRPTAQDLRGFGLVDDVLPGPVLSGTAAATTALRAALSETIGDLDLDPDRLARRRTRYGAEPDRRWLSP